MRKTLNDNIDEIHKIGCYSGSEKIIYLNNNTEKVTACVVAHEVAHWITDYYYPFLSRKEAEKIAHYVEDNIYCSSY